MLVPDTDLGKRCTDDGNTKEHMEIVLRWTATEGGFRFEAMDDITKKDLDGIKDEKRKSETRVCVVEVGTAVAGNDRNSKRPADDDDGTGNQ